MAIISALDYYTKLLMEDQRGNIKRLLGFDKEWADVFHEDYKQNAFMFAELFKRFSNKNKKEWKTYINSEHFVKDFQKFDEAIADIGLSFLLKNNPAWTKEINNSKPSSLDELRSLIKNLKGKLAVREPTKKPYMTFPNGFYWVLLLGSECKREGSLMQHCGKDDKGRMWSLRDKNNRPHVTLTLNIDSNIVSQVKGKQNTIPDKKYWKYVKDFVRKMDANVYIIHNFANDEVDDHPPEYWEKAEKFQDYLL